MLIRNAEIYGADDRSPSDLRITGGRIAEIGRLTAGAGETILDAGGGALLPGLHDHHIHLLSYAASLNSVRCGPPDVEGEAALIEALTSRAGSGWLRGYGYHESVAGEIDRHWLDTHLADRPARIQHRSGRLWVLNSQALNHLSERMTELGESNLAIPQDGRFYDADATLGHLLGRQLPPVAEASQQLAGFGVTGITDMTPGNDAESLTLFAELKATGTLRQHLLLAGAPALPFPSTSTGITTTATKIHLHDSALPEFDALCATISASHGRGRPIAVHCVTEVELVFALAALEQAGSIEGDRIEHASVTPPELLGTLARLNLTVVTQPNFIAERGDVYLRDLPSAEHDWLYRVRSFREQGIPLAAGTDAPFGSADPWIAIQAAVQRRTASGRIIGGAESLSPEAAVELFLGHPDRPALRRQVETGARADLCLLDRPWQAARGLLARTMVKATLCAGVRTY